MSSIGILGIRLWRHPSRMYAMVQGGLLGMAGGIQCPLMEINTWANIIK
jgi:hypothetical protein